MKIPQKYQFIIQLGKVLHTYGVPSYKIQEYLEQVSEQQGIKGTFMDLPTWINYVFYEEIEEQTYNHIERMPPGEWNLGALSKAVEITNEVLVNKENIVDAKESLKNIVPKPVRQDVILQAVAFAVSSGAFSILLGVNWISSILAAVLGLIVFGLTILAKHSGYVKSTLESLAPFVVTTIVGATTFIYSDINISLTILASIIVFIPGLAITTAIEEITSKSLVSGTAKLFDALVSLFKQFFGVILGLIFLRMFGDLQHNPVKDNIPEYVNYIAVVFLALSLLPVFQVRRKDVLYGIITGVLGYNIAILLWPAGILLSSFIGTVIVVIVSHVFSQITKTPKIVYLTQGIIMLVPGSKAFLGLSTLFLDNPMTSGNMWGQVAYILMGVIGGLIFTGSFQTSKQ